MGKRISSGQKHQTVLMPMLYARLSLLRDGRLLYRLKHRWRDGTTHVIYEPLELIERLAALVPPPRFNVTRYSGCLRPLQPSDRNRSNCRGDIRAKAFISKRRFILVCRHENAYILVWYEITCSCQVQTSSQNSPILILLMIKLTIPPICIFYFERITSPAPVVSVPQTSSRQC